jgi:hypothetical protein
MSGFQPFDDKPEHKGATFGDGFISKPFNPKPFDDKSEHKGATFGDGFISKPFNPKPFAAPDAVNFGFGEKPPKVTTFAMCNRCGANTGGPICSNCRSDNPPRIIPFSEVRFSPFEHVVNASHQCGICLRLQQTLRVNCGKMGCDSGPMCHKNCINMCSDCFSLASKIIATAKMNH